MDRRHHRIALGLLLVVLVVASPNVHGDVTGEFGTHVSMQPADSLIASEISTLLFDIETDVTLTVALSGLRSTFHTHFGLAGLEDVVLTGDAVLGAFDFSSQLVFGRFGYGSITPFYADPHFVEQRVRTRATLGGLQLDNVTAIADTFAFISPNSAHAFGTVFRVRGQTPSGVGVTGETGICMEHAKQRIKKHPDLGNYSVNPHCATSPKPTLLFDFEKFVVEGIPITSGVTVDNTIVCLTTLRCEFKGALHLTGTPIPLEIAFRFPDLFDLSFEGARLSLPLDPVSLDLIVNPDASIAAAIADVSWTLNPDTNPATVDARFELVPGLGFVDVDGDEIAVTLGLSVQRQKLTYQTDVRFGEGAAAGFHSLRFQANAPLAVGEIHASTTFTLDGLDDGTLDFRLPF